MRIVISGTVGIGKSTVSDLLSEKIKAKKHEVDLINEETVNSIYLDYYYKEPQNWAFIAQLDFLLGRFKQWLTNENKRQQYLEAGKKLITIYDRHFLDDYVFAELHTIKSNISNFNSLTYQSIYKEILEKMNKSDSRPDYFIMLKAPLETIIERLKSRARDEEINVNLEYWNDLYKNYYDRPMFQNHFRSNSKKYIEIDTLNKTPEEIVLEIMKIIQV